MTDRMLILFGIVCVWLAMMIVPSDACQVNAPGGMWSTPMCGAYGADRRQPKMKKAAAKTKSVRVQRTKSYSKLVSQQITYAVGGSHHAGPRPARWCGWWMRTQFGGGPEYNVAWNWRKRGVAASPHVGAVVVWRHHVGIIVGMNDRGQWLVKSGNDGGAVRVRARSVKGAVFRALV